MKIMVLLRLSRSRIRISPKAVRKAPSYLREPSPEHCGTGNSNFGSYRLGASPRLCFEKYVDVRAKPLFFGRRLTNIPMS